MISHKLVPKYMKQLELKSDLVSHRRYENKCIVTGQRALVTYVRMTKENAHTIKYSDSAIPITLYVLKCDHEWNTESCGTDRQPPGWTQQRKKETSI